MSKPIETLIKNGRLVMTMNDASGELPDCDIRVVNGAIAEVGRGLVSDGDVLNAAGCLVAPGVLNTHHHLYQSLMRAVPCRSLKAMAACRLTLWSKND